MVLHLFSLQLCKISYIIFPLINRLALNEKKTTFLNYEYIDNRLYIDPIGKNKS